MDSVEVGKVSSRPTFDFETELQNENSKQQDSARDDNPYEDADYLERRIPASAHDGPSSRSSPPYPDHFPDPRFANSDDQDVTLGQYMVYRVGDAFKGLFRNSHTILRVDLRQALRYDVPVHQKKKTLVGSRKVTPTGRRQPKRHYEFGNDAAERALQSNNWFQGLQGGGARLKLMQIWEFKNPGTEQDRRSLNVNFGVGANILMDRGEAEPKLRIRAQNLAFHFFPEPYLELRGKWPLGVSNLAISARYRSWSSKSSFHASMCNALFLHCLFCIESSSCSFEASSTGGKVRLCNLSCALEDLISLHHSVRRIPVSSMKALWESQSSQLLINLYHRSGRLFHLTPSGLEFEDPKIPFGQFGTMRLAASVNFPRQFPLKEGEQPFSLRIMRLGLKSRIM